MKNLKTKLLVACLISVFLSSCSKDGDNVQVVEVATDNPLQTDLDNAVHDSFKPYISNTKHIGLSIAVLNGNDTSYYNYGETHKGSKALPTQNSLYEIGSITKTLTALVVTRLLVDNELSVETPISLLLPDEINELSFGGESIKIKHLLNHTSGFPQVPNDMLQFGDLSDPFANYDYSKVVDYLNRFELDRTPGSQYEYSNIGFMLLGIIVAYQTDTSIEDFFSAIVQGVIRMNHTKMGLYQIVETNENVMGAYKSNGSEGYYWNMGVWEGAGGHYSNTTDMAKYARVHFDSYGDNLALKAIIDINKVETFSDNNVKVGRAWHIREIGNRQVFWHSGGTGGFNTLILIEPIQEKAIVVLANNTEVMADLLPATTGFFDNYIN